MTEALVYVFSRTIVMYNGHTPRALQLGQLESVQPGPPSQILICICSKDMIRTFSSGDFSDNICDAICISSTLHFQFSVSAWNPQTLIAPGHQGMTEAWVYGNPKTKITYN